MLFLSTTSTTAKVSHYPRSITNQKDNLDKYAFPVRMNFWRITCFQPRHRHARGLRADPESAVIWSAKVEYSCLPDQFMAEGRVALPGGQLETFGFVHQAPRERGDVV